MGTQRKHEKREFGTSSGAAQVDRAREERKLVHVPPEPNMPDEEGEATPRIDRMSGIREEHSNTSDSSGIPGDDERRGEERKKLYREGAAEVSETD